MYTGRADQPCCLCDNPKTVACIAVPPRAVTLMKNTVPITWRNTVGGVTLQLCESDQELVTELVLDLGMHPLLRCDVTRADFSIHEGFETLLNNTRDEPGQTEREDRLLAEVHAVVDDAGDPMVEERDLVEAHVVARVMAEFGVDQPM